MARVMIIGAGPRGLACGQTLRAAGHDVELIEAGRRPGGQARLPEGLALDGATQETLRVLGVSPSDELHLVRRTWPEPAAPRPETGWVASLKRLANLAISLGGRAPEEDPTVPGRIWLDAQALISKLTEDLSIRIGWEALEVVTRGKAASLLLLVPSGERRFEVDAVVLAVGAEEALRLVPELGSGAAPIRGEERCHLSIDFADEPKGSVPDESWHLDPASSPDLEEVLVMASRGVKQVRLSSEAAGRLAEEPDEVKVEVARKGMQRLPLGEAGRVLAIHGWSEPVPPPSMADFPGAVFWARSPSGSSGLQAALESGHRAGLEVASFLRADD